MTIPRVRDTPLPPRGPHSGPVQRLVVHCMGERIGAASAWQHLQQEGLSAHALIEPDGTILRCVPRDQIAYHTKGFNDRSLGVELLVSGVSTYDGLAQAVGWNLSPWGPAATLPADPYTPAQYESLVWWLRDEQAAAGHPLPVTFHDALSPERKFDPGPVFRRAWLLAQVGAPTPTPADL